MRRPAARVLAECLEWIERGERTPEECLARHPELRAELEPLLDMAATVRRASGEHPRPVFRRDARRRLLARLHDRAAARRRLWNPARWATAAVWAVAICAVLLVSGSVVAYAADDALPGDAFYPVKTAVEEVRLALSGDREDVTLYLHFAAVRVQEVEELVDAGRVDDLPAAVNRLGTQVGEASGRVGRVAARDAELGQELAAQVDQAHVDYRERLGRVHDAAPDPARPSIERAIRELEDEDNRSHDDSDDSPAGQPTGTPATDRDDEEQNTATPSDDGDEDRTVATPAATPTSRHTDEDEDGMTATPAVTIPPDHDGEDRRKAAPTVTTTATRHEDGEDHKTATPAATLTPSHDNEDEEHKTATPAATTTPDHHDEDRKTATPAATVTPDHHDEEHKTATPAATATPDYHDEDRQTTPPAATATPDHHDEDRQTATPATTLTPGHDDEHDSRHELTAQD